VTGEIRDCDFVNNENSDNGMIYWNRTGYTGTKVLYNCRFYGKISTACIFGDGLTLYNCIITNNINATGGTPFFKDSTFYNCIISDNRQIKSSNKSQADNFPHLLNCKLYNCTFRVTEFSRLNPQKPATGNEIQGCVLVNTVVDAIDGYGTSTGSWFLGPCGNLYATNSCLPEAYVLSNALKGASNNIYYGPERACKKTGLITEGDKQHQLAKGSVCIDSGWDGKSENNPAGFAYLKSSDANEFYGIDYFGSKRISGKAVDIGASERAIPGFTIRVR
jgi:hypothetical protein